MFPCYLFVRAVMPHDFRRVASTPGVRGFIANSNGPAPVDDTVIAFLRSRESADGVIRYDALPVGQDVRIVSGPLKGLVAIVQRRMPARERVAVLLHLLQRDTIVELPEHWIRRL
jgi:transcriptional antiterminator NusG